MSQPNAAIAANARVLLVPAQRPEQELNALMQIVASRGLMPDQSAGRQGNSWVLETPDGSSYAKLTLLMEIGVFRLFLAGKEAELLDQTIGSYLPVMDADSAKAQIEESRTASEKALYSVLTVLAYPDARTAMSSAGTELMEGGDESVMQGVVQGLLLLESPDAATELESMAVEHAGTPVGDLAKRGLTMLAERGIAADTPETLVARAEAQIEAGEHADALEILEPLLESGETPNAGLLAAITALRALERADEIPELVHPPRATDPGAADVLVALGRALEAAGELEAARERFGTALEIEPENEAAVAGRDRLDLELDQSSGSDEERLAKLDAGIEAHPEDGGMRVQRARVRVATGDFQGALDDLKVADKHDAEDRSIPVLRARAALGAGDYATALKAATIATNDKNADSSEVGLLRGRSFLALDDGERALRAFKLTGHDEPALATEASLGRGIALERLGRADDARAAYAEAKAGDPAGALARLDPIVFDPLPLLTEVTGQTVEPIERPETPTGRAIDPYFKVCKACGASAMKRRTSCRECAGKDFYTAG